MPLIRIRHIGIALMIYKPIGISVTCLYQTAVTTMPGVHLGKLIIGPDAIVYYPGFVMNPPYYTLLIRQVHIDFQYRPAQVMYSIAASCKQ